MKCVIMRYNVGYVPMDIPWPELTAAAAYTSIKIIAGNVYFSTLDIYNKKAYTSTNFGAVTDISTQTDSNYWYLYELVYEET